MTPPVHVNTVLLDPLVECTFSNALNCLFNAVASILCLLKVRLCRGPKCYRWWSPTTSRLAIWWGCESDSASSIMWELNIRSVLICKVGTHTCIRASNNNSLACKLLLACAFLGEHVLGLIFDDAAACRLIVLSPPVGDTTCSALHSSTCPHN